MNKSFARTLTFSIAFLFLFSIVLIGCGDRQDNTSPQGSEQQTPADTTDEAGADSHNESLAEKEAPEELPPQPYTTSGKLIAVGDIMMHSPQIPAAYNAETNTYSFETYFEAVKPWLQGEWVIANLETPLAGEELRGYSGYPEFNAPAELADALIDAGFGIVSTANNHSLDRREQGVLNTLQNVKERGLIPVGTYDSPEAAAEIAIVEQNEIAMAFLAYTYGTNGIPIPQGKDYLVNLIDVDKIKSDIKKAKDEGADLVTISMHFGYEYHRKPNEEQKELSRTLIEAGADIILGSHPHVVQPYEFLDVTTEDGTPRRGLVIYSLGNFISNQGPDQGTAKYTDVGVIFSVEVQKHFPEGTIELGVVETVPTWVHKYHQQGKRQYRILPIEATVTAKDDPLLSKSQYDLLDAYLAEMSSHLESMAVPVHTPAP